MKPGASEGGKIDVRSSCQGRREPGQRSEEIQEKLRQGRRSGGGPQARVL